MFKLLILLYGELIYICFEPFLFKKKNTYNFRNIFSEKTNFLNFRKIYKKYLKS